MRARARAARGRAAWGRGAPGMEAGRGQGPRRAEAACRGRGAPRMEDEKEGEGRELTTADAVNGSNYSPLMV